MANPRYQMQDSPQNSKAAQLQQILGLVGLNQEQRKINQQGQEGQTLAALRAIGLMNDQQRQQQEGQQFTQTLGLHRDQLNQQVSQQNQDRTTGALHARLAGLIPLAQSPDPHISGPAIHALGIVFPEFAQGQQQQKQQETQAGVAALTPAVTALYQANKNDIPKLQQGLSGMEQGMAGKQDVWNGLPWDQLNQSLPATPQQGATSVPGAIGSVIHHTPAAVLGLLQGGEDAMTNMGQDFWAHLLGIQPQQPDPRNFQQKVQQSKAWPWQ